MKRPPGLAALDRAQSLRQFSTEAEKLLWKHLRNRQLGGAKFRRQVWLDTYIADFVCLEARLVIEADGGQHDAASGYDTQRSSALSSNGFRVRRFWNNDILRNIEQVLGVIAADLAEKPSPSHRVKNAAGPSLSPSGRGNAAGPTLSLPLREREGKGT